MLCCFLAGQFYHGIQFEMTELLQSPDAIMYVKAQTLNVTRWNNLTLCTTHGLWVVPLCLHGDVKNHLLQRHWQKDFSQQVTGGKIIPCWFVINNRSGLIDGDPSDYIVSALFDTVSYTLCVCVFIFQKYFSLIICPFRIKKKAILHFHITAIINILW